MFIEEKTLTSELRGQRTLAAIMFTDVVGFSALMAANEEYTLDLLRRDFQLIKQLCQRFEGKVLKTIGDALLMYFSSAVQAVACAKQMQLSFAKLAVDLAPEEILTHRVGIHLGDVFFNGTDVMGDGVNIAARLQSEAQPGGICISQIVYDVVKTPLALKVTELVQKKLKNIPDCVTVYQIPPLYPTPFTNQWELDSAQNSQAPSSNDSNLVIHSSGQWALLDENFFQVETSCQNADGTLTLQIPSNSLQDDAALQSLRPNPEQPKSINFSYQNYGLLVQVRRIEVESREDYHLWSLTLEPENIKIDGSIFEQSYQGRKRFYSADDIAQLKARRLLLNDPPKLLSDARLFTPASAEREMIEKLIRSSATPVKVEDCVLQTLYPLYKDRPKLFLELARLKAIYYLKAAAIVDQVLELSLRLVSPDKVHVRLRGKRRHIYVDIEPAIIEVEGDCSLVSEV